MAAQSGNPKKTALRCLAATGTAALFALIAIGLFNALIDPLAMFKFVDLPTLNRHKPAIYPRARIPKAYEVRRIAPTGVIIGSSRTHLGLRPSHEGWAPKATPRYNLGFDGATIKEMYLWMYVSSPAGKVTGKLAQGSGGLSAPFGLGSSLTVCSTRLPSTLA